MKTTTTHPPAKDMPATHPAAKPRRPLDVIQVENPCRADWASMSGDERTRFCAHCQRHVHDLSAMTEDEATRLVCEQAGRLCVRFSRDAAGRVMTLDYQEPSPRRRGWRFWGLVGTGGALASWVLSLLVSSRPAATRPTVVAGMMSCRPATMPAPLSNVAAPTPPGAAQPPPSGDADAEE